MSAQPSGILASFRFVDAAAAAVRRLKDEGYRDFTVYTPVPNVEIARAVGHRASPVRLWTLVGGLTGCASGFALTLWMSYDWPVVVGGKPIGSVIPYVVIAFELTILFGAGATILGLLYHTWKSRQVGAYDNRFADDHIGIFVPCTDERREPVQSLLREAGAEEVEFAS
jgi:molybdopterin-containing oxidoreductase family membrane subunit